LQLCSMSPEATTTLHEEMSESPGDRDVVEAALHRPAARGLLCTHSGVYGGVQQSWDGTSSCDRLYEDDWWDATTDGRRAVEAC
jgi:hypothetical protein